MELPEAEAFIDPVPEDVPGYYAATRHPMDLGTGEGGGGGGGGGGDGGCASIIVMHVII